MLEGTDAGAKNFYSLLANDCDLKGTSLSEFFRKRFVEALVCGASYLVVDFPRTTGPALTRAEEDAAGTSRAYLVDYGADEVINWNYDPNGGTGLGGDPDVVPAAIQGDGCEVGTGDAVDLLRPGELSDLPEGGRGASRSRESTKGGTGWRRWAGCRCSRCG